MIRDWTARKVTVMGLGRFGGGVGVTRWLARQGARLTVTDTAPREKLESSLSAIADLNVSLKLGGHDAADFRDADVVVASPAVPGDSPFLRAARDAGVAITSEMNLFVERCRARCIGVTGSVGKSTVTSMIGHVLESASAISSGGERRARGRPVARRTWVGGNIGTSLLEVLDEIADDDLVVLELSSFQLESLGAIRWSPHVAVLTNVVPNHLDRHGTFAAYLAAKLNIVRFQTPGRDQVIIHDSPDLRRHFELMFGDLSGIWRYNLDGDKPVARCQTTPAVDCDDREVRWPELKLDVPGRHNRLNAAAALTVAHMLGMEDESALTALARYVALPDRLARVAVVDGATYYNDSKSTTPQATLTAMQAVDGPLILILGGYDKHIDLTEVARSAARRCKFVACIGQTGPRIAELVRAADGLAACFPTLDEALAACRERATPGDSVVLSPASASYDMFEDYRARGAAFTRVVRGWLNATTAP